MSTHRRAFALALSLLVVPNLLGLGTIARRTIGQEPAAGARMASRYSAAASTPYSPQPPRADLLPSLDAPRSETPPQDVLLLRNGGVLRGLVTREGDRFIVTFDTGSRMRINSDQIERHCRSIDEAYAHHRASLVHDSADERMKLAEWCLREGYLPGAREQIDAAERLVPNDDRLRRLRLRLELSERPPSTPDITPAELPVTADEIDGAVRQLPAESVSHFATTIQPLLLNRCGTAACHGSAAASSFRLIRPSWAKTLPQRLTLRNLHSTLMHVDAADPNESPILRFALTPHGRLDEPIFKDNEHYQWRQLQRWIASLNEERNPGPVALRKPTTVLSNQSADGIGGAFSEGPSPTPSRVPGETSVSPSVMAPPGVVPRNIGREPDVESDSPVEPSNAANRNPSKMRDPASAKRRVTSYRAADSTTLIPRRIPSPDAGSSEDRPAGANRSGSAAAPPVRDPFDPEIFNRRYLDAPARGPGG